MKRKNNKGFSLIELIIAIAILVILTGLLAPQFMRYMEKSREAKDMQVLDTLYSGVQVALGNEKAYDEVQDTAKFTELKQKTGMSLAEILADADSDKATDFSKEVKATLGSKTEDKLWSSKAAKDPTVNAYVSVDPTTLKVNVWLGIKDSTPDSPLSPDTTPATAGTIFVISK